MRFYFNHWGCAETHDDGRWDEGVERGVELGPDVDRVAELADDQGPLDFDRLDHPCGDEHARNDQRDVDRRLGRRPQSGVAVDGALQGRSRHKKVDDEILPIFSYLKVSHGVVGREETHEGEADDPHVLPDAQLFLMDLLRRHGPHGPHPIVRDRQIFRRCLFVSCLIGI